MCLICSYWLGLTQLANSEDSLFDLFSDRYKNRIASLGALGQNTSYSKFNEKFDDHIREEWSYFLDGTYGLCTKPGLPEDIAPHELERSSRHRLIDEVRRNYNLPVSNLVVKK